MKRPTGLKGLFFCHFASHLRNGDRVVRSSRVIIYGIIPVLVGIALAAKIGIPSDTDLPLIVAVLAVLAAVLVGLLPLIHSVIGQANPDRQYAYGENEVAQQEIDRIQTLQDLHAAISLAVVLLVLGLIACMVFPFLGVVQTGLVNSAAPLRQYRAWEHVVALILSWILFAVAASTCLTFFDIAKGIFEAVESHAESLKRRIRNNVQKKPGPDEEII